MPPRGLRDVLKWMRNRRREPVPADLSVRTSVPPGEVRDGLLTTLVNHSTVLLQQPGWNALTDPIWSGHCGPWGVLGPRRLRTPGVEFDQLPHINAVLLSHNHYDHLDLPTLKRLHKRGDGRTRFVVPLGVGRLLASQGIGPVDELDWGDRIEMDGVAVHSTPAFHFSGRGLFDRDRTLWCGYVLESAVGLVYFAGDTGYGKLFDWIRDRFGAPRLALLPVGAYEPRWFMSPVHMDPAQALQARRTLGAAFSIGIHQGTFQLADESIDAPRRVLQELGAEEEILVPANGESKWIGTL